MGEKQPKLWDERSGAVQPETLDQVTVMTVSETSSDRGKRLRNTLYPVELERCKNLIEQVHLQLVSDFAQMKYSEVQALLSSLRNCRRKRSFSGLMDYADDLGKRCADEGRTQGEQILDKFWRVVESVRRAERRRLGKPDEEPENDAST